MVGRCCDAARGSCVDFGTAAHAAGGRGARTDARQAVGVGHQDAVHILLLTHLIDNISFRRAQNTSPCALLDAI